MISWIFQQYVWGAGFGLLTGYLWWGLPGHIEAIKDRKARRIRTEIDRIEGGFTSRLYMPNTPPPPPLRERLVERWDNWIDAWRDMEGPRTPEKVAEMAYQREIRR